MAPDLGTAVNGGKVGNVQDAESAEVELTKWQACISYIPGCGGWCIPNASPETSCLRHFSNEHTVFRVFAKNYKLRSYIEHSQMCRKAGGVGFNCAERARVPIMLLALVCSICASFAMFISTFAVSYDPKIVRRVSWARVTYESADPNVFVKIRYDFGINLFVEQVWGIGIDYGYDSYFDFDLVLDPDAYFMEGVSWGADDACEVYGDGILDAANRTTELLEDFCEKCQEASGRVMFFIIMSICMQFLQIKKNLQRLTPYGDINCQKFNGMAASVVGMLTGSIALILFYSGCYDHYPPELSFSVREFTTTQERRFPLRAKKGVGPGFALMAGAVGLKFVDMWCHISVKTPEAKQEPVEPGTTMTEYMLRCSKPTRYGQTIVEGDVAEAETSASKAPRAV